MRLATKNVIITNSRYNQGTMQDEYSSVMIKGVSWFARVGASQSVDGMADANTVVMRIPQELTNTYMDAIDYKSSASIGDGVWTLAVGDRVVLIQDTPYLNSNVLNDIPYYTIVSVTDNRGKKGGHIKVILE